jgi:hemoglobin
VTDPSAALGGAASEATLYQRVGGEAYFRALVERFYEGVERDPVLRPLYPEDLEPGKAHLAAFLVQYWGGPTTYSEERGHPRLRMRHAPFSIGSAQRDAWFGHMATAVRGSGAGADEQAELLAYFEMAANHLVNQPI